MSSQPFFIFVCIIPSLITAILLVKAQRKFLRSYRKIINPEKPMLSDEIRQNLFKKGHSLETLKDFYTGYGGRVLDAYYKHYDNPILEKQASLVRKLIIAIFIVPLIGFILSFIYTVKFLTP